MNKRFSQRRERMLRLKVLREGAGPVRRTEAQPVFEQCPACGTAVPKGKWAENLYVCPACGHHRPIGAYLRLSMLLDAGTFRELDERLCADNVLDFPGYDEKLAVQRRRTGLAEAAVAAMGRVCGAPVVLAVMDSRFLMGSMGAAVGEKIARAADAARKGKLPLVIFCASGGARMQEGILSLMQMAKTAEAITRFQAAGGLYISWLTHPTTGGVTASFASLGDVTLAEARRADRLCRPARDRADHRPDAARGLSARGVSGGARLCGRRGAPQRNEADALQAAAPARERGRGAWLNRRDRPSARRPSAWRWRARRTGRARRSTSPRFSPISLSRRATACAKRTRAF